MIYEVKKGDSLSKIGSKFGVKWQAIFEKNKDQIKNPNLIYPGQKLQIPVNTSIAKTEVKTDSFSPIIHNTTTEELKPFAGRGLLIASAAVLFFWYLRKKK